MGVIAMARGVYGNDRKLQLALLAFMLLCYGALLGMPVTRAPCRGL